MKFRHSVLFFLLFVITNPVLPDGDQGDLGKRTFREKACVLALSIFGQKLPPFLSRYRSIKVLDLDKNVPIYTTDGLVVGKKLGEGAFGVVHYANWPTGKRGKLEEWALKSAKTEDRDENGVIVKAKKEKFEVRLQSLYREYLNLQAIGQESYLIYANGKVQLATRFFENDPHSFSREGARTVESVFKEGALPVFESSDPLVRWQFIRDVAESAADQLTHAHEHHIIHADVKPGNMLFRMKGNRLAKLLLNDWGAGVDSRLVEEKGYYRGTEFYMGQEAMMALKGKATPQRDTDALARSLEELYLHPIVKTAPTGETEILGQRPEPVSLLFDSNTWLINGRVAKNRGRYGIGRVVDDRPDIIPPQVALVLAGRLAKTPAQLMSFIAHAEKAFRGSERTKEEFARAYAAEWSKNFAEAVEKKDYTRAELLQYGLLAAPNLGPQILKHLPNANQKSMLIQTAKNWQKWTQDPTFNPPKNDVIMALGRHRYMNPLLEKFLESVAPARALAH